MVEVDESEVVVDCGMQGNILTRGIVPRVCLQPKEPFPTIRTST